MGEGSFLEGGNGAKELGGCNKGAQTELSDESGDEGIPSLPSSSAILGKLGRSAWWKEGCEQPWRGKWVVEGG